MGYSLGVDVGTTSVVAAVVEKSRARVLTLDDRSPVVPSAVYRRGDGSLIVGRHAVSRTVSSPGRVARGFVRDLGVRESVALGGQPFTVPVLVATLLHDVAQRVRQAQGGPPETVTVAHPGSWEAAQRLLLEDATEQAGLPRATLITAPQAAAAHYLSLGRSDEDAPVVVYDLGGGTFDAAVLRAEEARARPEFLGTPEGARRLGGMDFDETLTRHVERYGGNQLSGLDPRDPGTAVAWTRLRQDCARAKELLSTEPEVLITVILAGRHFEVPVTRAVLADAIGAWIESTVQALRRTLDSAPVGPEEVGAILLLGGSSRMPLVTRMVGHELARRVAVDDQLRFAVALGAAALANVPATAASATPAAAAAGRHHVSARIPPEEAPSATAPTPAPPPPRRHAPAHPHTATAPASPQPGPPRGRRRRRPMLIAGGVLLAAGLAAAGVAAWSTRSSPATPAMPAAASLVLTTAAVKIDDSYYATATGFAPDEPVRLSWTGPTTGVMDAAPADASGARRHGPVVEQDPPGDYQIIATGLQSGRSASAPLLVLPAD